VYKRDPRQEVWRPCNKQTRIHERMHGASGLTIRLASPQPGGGLSAADDQRYASKSGLDIHEASHRV
jgi:hypothetical protein